MTGPFVAHEVAGVDQLALRFHSVVPGCNNVQAMKPQAPTASPADKGKLRFGLPGSTKERSGRIKAAIRANRETLRRLAK